MKLSPKNGHAFGRARHRAVVKHQKKLELQRQQAAHRRRGYRFRSCERKTRYMTKREAESHQLRQQKAKGYPLYVYPCQFCQGFHLSKEPPKEHH